jgi:ribosomal protein L11 methyltransferase
LADWIALTLETDRESIEALSALFMDCGANGLEEAPPEGKAPTLIQPWETDRKAPVYARATLRAWLDKAGSALATARLDAEYPHISYQLNPVQEEDWSEAWKQHHHRVEISPNFAVSPPWEAKAGDLIIPPGNAFGTGAHPSTLECTRKIVALAPECKQCLDVGCGSGILALTAAKLGLSALGIDIDEASVLSANENAKLNGLHADFSTTPLRGVQGRYDLVVANLFAEVLTALSAELLRVTERHLVLAGILNEKADGVIAALCPELELVESIQDDAWTCLHLVRPA